MIKVFFSSTVFDLIDVRTEIFELLRGIGVSPVMSEKANCDFDYLLDTNSIETCLINLASCDVAIFVLDQRYGPPLKPLGLEVSATHHEYRHAKEKRMRFMFYVRDRLEADYQIWKANSKKPEIALSWVKDRKILEFLDEHRQLNSNNDSNWVSLFSTSFDLKESIGRRLDPVIQPTKLKELLEQNRFPLFELTVEVEPANVESTPSLCVRIDSRNISQVPAWNCRYRILDSGKDWDVLPLVIQGQSISQTALPLLGRKPARLAFELEYDSSIGITVKERHEIHADSKSGTVFAGSNLLERNFYYGQTPLLEIKNPGSDTAASLTISRF